MTWNGSGTFSRTNGVNTGTQVWQDDRDDGTKIRADRHDTHDQDLSDGINACLAKNGENAATANLDVGGFIITNIGDGTADDDAASVGQVQSGASEYANDTGVADAYSITLSPAITAYSAGQTFRFRAGNANTGASTLNVNGAGLRNIFLNESALSAGAIPAGSMVVVTYNAADSRFDMISNGNGVYPSVHVESGSAALPSLSFSIDTNTGIFRQAADVIGITSGGSEVMRIGSSILACLNDNYKITTGASSDIAMFHDGTQCFIEGQTGGLYFDNRSHGSSVFLRGEDTGGTLRVILEGDPDANTFLYYNGTQMFATLVDGCQISGDIFPNLDDTHDCGKATRHWTDVYATNGTIQTSDIRAKYDLRPCDFGLEFVEQLEPIVFKRTGGVRDHYGFGAQDIEAMLSSMGRSTKEFGGFIKSEIQDDDGNPTGEVKYGLRYEEFIAPMVKAIQELSAANKALEARVAALESAAAIGPSLE